MMGLEAVEGIFCVGEDAGCGKKGPLGGSGEGAWGSVLGDGIGLRKDGGWAVEDWQLIACEWNA